MSYPYPRLFLDIRLAKKRLEKVLGPACSVGERNLAWTLAGRDLPERSSPYRTVLCRLKAEAGQSRLLRSRDRTDTSYRRQINRCQGEFDGRSGTNVPVKEFQMFLRQELVFPHDVR
jgi:hypothetical protein